MLTITLGRLPEITTVAMHKWLCSILPEKSVQTTTLNCNTKGTRLESMTDADSITDHTLNLTIFELFWYISSIRPGSSFRRDILCVDATAIVYATTKNKAIPKYWLSAQIAHSKSDFHLCLLNMYDKNIIIKPNVTSSVTCVTQAKKIPRQAALVGRLTKGETVQWRH